MRKQYEDMRIFKVFSVVENDKHKHFIVTDRNDEKMSSERFATAAEAMERGYELLKERGIFND